MNKIFLTLLCTGLLFGAKYETYSEYQTISAEKAKLQGYQKILLSLDDGEELSKFIDKRVYFDNLDTYFSSKVDDMTLKRYIKTLSKPNILKINKSISENFSYKENSEKYLSYLSSFKKKLPEKERMELSRDIVLESSDVYLFMKVVRENIPEELLSDKSTFQKNNYFEKIKKKALKYYILRTLFVTKELSIKELKSFLSFLQSSEYKKVNEFKNNYTRSGFMTNDKTDETKEVVVEISNEDIESAKKILEEEKKEEEEKLKALVNQNNSKVTSTGKKILMSKKQINEFKDKQKELEYSRKIKEAQVKAQEEGFDPLTFDPLSIDDE